MNFGQVDENLKYFCDNCGTLINVEILACPLCKKQFDEDFLRHTERTKLLAPKGTDQDEKYEKEGARTVINERCPHCSHEGLYFSTAQLRSADEGATVFYECPECGYRFTQNN